MSLEKAKTSGKDFMVDVYVHERFALRDLPRLRALCHESALRVGLDENQALMFVLAIDHRLLNALRRGDGPALLTVLRRGTDRLVARVAASGTGKRAPGTGERAPAPGCWRAARWAPRPVDTATFRSGQRGPLRLVVVVPGREAPEPTRRTSPPNTGHFA